MAHEGTKIYILKQFVYQSFVQQLKRKRQREIKMKNLEDIRHINGRGNRMKKNEENYKKNKKRQRLSKKKKNKKETTTMSEA